MKFTITNIDERNYPSHPFHKFSFVSPASKANVPADAASIELPSRKATMLARVDLKTTQATRVRRVLCAHFKTR